MYFTIFYGLIILTITTKICLMYVYTFTIFVGYWKLILGDNIKFASVILRGGINQKYKSQMLNFTYDRQKSQYFSDIIELSLR